MPLGTKTTQTDSEAELTWFLNRILTNDLYRQVEKTQRQMQGFEMGSIVGNDQNTLLCDLMHKIGIKCRKMWNGFRNPFWRLVMQENTLNGFECRKTGDNNSKMCVCGTVKVVK